MKLSKRIIALAFAVMLIAAFATQASAAQVIETGRYRGIFYNTITYCERVRCSGTLECDDSSMSKSVILIYIDGLGVEHIYPGPETTDIVAGSSRIVPDGIQTMTAKYLFNNTVVHTRSLEP